MLKQRVIPIILLKDGSIVQSRLFSRYQPVGNPFATVKRYNSWDCDELIYLNISRQNSSAEMRTDLNSKVFSTMIDILKEVAQENFIPLTFGGGIRTLKDMELFLTNGADKITVNTLAIESPQIISEAAKEFGSQSIVVSIDAKVNENKEHFVYLGGKTQTEIELSAFCTRVEEYGAGELLINSIDRDGSGRGYDVDLVKKATKSVNIPVIIAGGAGKWEDMQEILEHSPVSGVAAANIFHHSENSVYNCRQFLFDHGINVRKPAKLSFLKRNL